MNCKGSFAAGVAKQIRNKHPLAAQAYIDKFLHEGWKLGDVQFVKLPGGLTIANCATQYGYGYAGDQRVFVNYEAVAAVFTTLVKYSELGNSVAMPRIGAGLAGGDWNIILKLLEDAAKDKDVDITVYSL